MKKSKTLYLAVLFLILGIAIADHINSFGSELEKNAIAFQEKESAQQLVANNN